MMQVVPWIGRTVVQNAYVVEDLDAAMARWTTVFGAGPFFANRDIRIDDARYRGEPTRLRFAGAIAQAGDVQIELIQQLDDSPSCYRDLYPAGSEGFHHIAVFVDDLDADIARYEALGAPVAFSGVSRGMRFAYVDTSPMLGIMGRAARGTCPACARPSRWSPKPGVPGTAPTRSGVRRPPRPP